MISLLPAQPDLFGDDDATATQRLRDGLTVLADVYPNALEILCGDRRPSGGEIKTSASGPWAYSVRRDGFYYQDRASWSAAAGAWHRCPTNLLAWDELDTLTAHDPRIVGIRAWSNSLTAIDTWKDRSRPHELWPNPEGWHPSYIESDHARPGWPQRLDAWRTTIAVYVDARSAL